MHRLIGLAVALLLGMSAVTASAQEPSKFPLELNRLEQDGAVCRVYLLVKNPETTEASAFKLDLVFFDKGNIIRNRLYVELGPLAASKTAVRLFDIPDFQCAEMGSILVNDVVACAAPDGSDLNCLKRLELSSRAEGVPLSY